MWSCDGCASGYLDPRPDAAHIAMAYGSYYTHAGQVSNETPRRPGPIGWLRRAVLNQFLNKRFGGERRPALPGGYMLLKAMPEQRIPLEYGWRHLRKLPPGGALLDFGCGNGDFLSIAQRIGWLVEGVDPDPAAVSAARALGLPVRLGEIEAFDSQKDQFDQITLNHVIEHVPNPATLARVCFQLLRPGGVLYVETPNLESNGHRRFGAAWRGLEVPRHLQVFSRAGLAGLLQRAGFASVEDLPATDSFQVLAEESRVMATKAIPPIIIPDEPEQERGRWASDPQFREFLTMQARKPG